ncbi:hypothetical protein BD779DRAFT_1666262 [Infundibulicybe gibba]|nr:hypothetical protein BD779DRAFT_1666262 [Infundibulicybe gibba]
MGYLWLRAFSCFENSSQQCLAKSLGRSTKIVHGVHLIRASSRRHPNSWPFPLPPSSSSSITAFHSMDPSHNYSREPDFKHVVASAFSVLDQPPPPTLREILGAYRTKGDGDRDMLLAMLNAKAAEDQRLASVAALHRSVLEAYQNTSTPINTHYHARMAAITIPPPPLPNPPHVMNINDQPVAHITEHLRAVDPPALAPTFHQ